MTRVLLILAALTLTLTLNTTHAQSDIAPSPNKAIRLKTHKLHYNQATQTFVASQNVTLDYDNIKISTSKLVLSANKKQATSTNNITIMRGDDYLKASKIHLNLIDNIVHLQAVKGEILAPDSTDPLYIRAHSLEDHHHYKIGTKGIITTCDLEDPHFFLKAGRFIYTPKKHIIGYNVFYYNPIWIIPFGFWTPFYYYDISKRRIVWNFPSIGRKETPGWGWFMQNTIDYNNIDGEDSSILLDWYENKGIGWGVRHQYKTTNTRGTFYYYRLDEQDTGDENQKIAWNQNWQITDPLSLKVNFSQIDAERINSSGRQDQENKSVDLTYDELGDKYQLKVEDNQNRIQNLNTKFASFQRSFNGEELLYLSLNQSQYRALSRKDTTGELRTSTQLSTNSYLDNNLNFKRLDTVNDGLTADDRLDYALSYQYDINEHLYFNLNLNTTFDLDEDRVTKDSFSNLNDAFLGLPELKLNYERDIKGISFKEKITIARYREIKYINSIGKQRKFPDTGNFDVEPNTYIFQTEASKAWSLGDATTFSIGSTYDQYLFKIEDKELFEGDAFYTVGFNSGLNTTLWSFLSSNTTYTSRYAPEENNSPFFQFDAQTSQENSIAQTLRLFYQDTNYLYWLNNSGYNFSTDRWVDWTTEVGFNPNDKFNISINTGKKLDPQTTSERQNRFHPLTTILHLKGPSGIQINYDIAFDLNKWRDQDETHINSSTLQLKFNLGSKEDSRWECDINFAYDTESPNDKFRSSRYEAQTISLIKNEHKRKLTISYNRLLEEFRLKMTINAFPNDAIGFKKTRDIWKVEGILDDTTQERL